MAVVVLFLDDAVVGEERGVVAHAEDAVADELGWFVSHVATLSDNLYGHH